MQLPVDRSADGRACPGSRPSSRRCSAASATFPGAALGGFLIGVVETLVVGYGSASRPYRDAIAFGVLILILLFKPTGPARARSRREKV